MHRKSLIAGALVLVAACGKAQEPQAIQAPVIAVPPPTTSVEPIAIAPSTATTPVEAPDEPAASSCDGVRLEIKAVVNQGYTSFEGELINDGSKTLTLVEPGDGSDVGWRTPILTWKTTTLAGAPATIEPQGRCGNVNAIDEKEVFKLGPGQRHPISWLGSPSVKPGRYSVRLVYENDPKKGLDGIALGGASATAIAKIKKSTPCKITSPAMTVAIQHP